MRCAACDVALTDYESTRKSLITNQYYDLCNNCFKTIKDDLTYKDRIDLATANDMYETDGNDENDNYDELDY